MRTINIASLSLITLLWSATLARGAEPLPKKLQGVTVHEKLGQPAAIDARFTDHRGKTLALRDLLDGERPVLMTLNYYRCRTLCNIQLNALVRALRGLEWTPGDNFRMVTVGIDHRETPELARNKRKSYLEALGRGEVDWTFLVGQKEMIRKVADSVGFTYRYDAEQDQYAHPALAVFLSPDGKVSRYNYGLEFNARDIKFALIDASRGKVGSTVDRIILSCFHYDATSGKYGPWAFGIMRLAGVVTLLALGSFIGLMFWRERRLRRKRDAADTHGPTPPRIQETQ